MAFFFKQPSVLLLRSISSTFASIIRKIAERKRIPFQKGRSRRFLFRPLTVQSYYYRYNVRCDSASAFRSSLLNYNFYSYASVHGAGNLPSRRIFL
jgi:hypothetical protein